MSTETLIINGAGSNSSPSSTAIPDDNKRKTVSSQASATRKMTETHPSMTIPLSHRVAYIVVGSLQTMCISGVIYGWGSLEGEHTVMTSSPAQGGAGLTVEQTTAMFATAASVTFLSSLPMGWLLDVAGPRFASVLTHAIALLGCHCFTVVPAQDDGSSYYTVLTFGLACMALGPNIASVVIHLANLFPHRYNLIVGGMNGSIAFSFLVFPLFERLWQEHGIPVQHLFGTYRWVIALSLLASAVLWPDRPYPQLLLSEEAQNADKSATSKAIATTTTHVNESSSVSTETTQLLARTDLEGDVEQVVVSTIASSSTTKPTLPLRDQSLWNQATSGTYFRMFLLFLTTSFSANFAIASFPLELDSNNDYLPSSPLTETFTIVYSFGIFPALLIGYWTDTYGLVPCTTLLFVVASLYQILTWALMQYNGDAAAKHYCLHWTLRHVVAPLSFVLYSCFRQFLFRIFVSSLSIRLGFSYFGTLLGIAFAQAGVAQLGIAPLITFVEANELWNALHWVQALLFLLLLIIPYMDAMAEQQKRQKSEAH